MCIIVARSLGENTFVILYNSVNKPRQRIAFGYYDDGKCRKCNIDKNVKPCKTLMTHILNDGSNLFSHSNKIKTALVICNVLTGSVYST